DHYLDAGRNPPEGVIVHYWVRDKADSVRIAILDADGNEVRSYTSKRDKRAPADEGDVQQATASEEVTEDEAEEEDVAPFAPNEPGMNRLVWDYRYAKPVKIETGSRGSREEALEGVGAPRAIPGEYQVQLTVGDASVTERFRLLADPRLSVSADELRAQF